ncbi:MAG: hypothetical protein ABS36_03980 [Acidobacteria bacterium SCN 69-37]|nr:MAG: hypothetical protein ABS36_03980 [Acidobacteria bacterium SCN 69-37]
MRRIIVFSTALVVAAALASATLSAQRPAGPNRGDDRSMGPRARMAQAWRGAGPGDARVPRGVTLTSEQRTKVQDLARDARTKTQPLAGDLRAAEQALRAAIFADTQDEAAVKAAAATVAQLRQQLADIRLNTSTAIAAVLTPEQREQVRVGARRGPDAERGGPGRGPARGDRRGSATGRS